MSNTFFYYKVSYFSDLDNTMKEDDGIIFVGFGKFCDAVAEVADQYGEETIESIYINCIDTDTTCLTLADLKDFLGRLNPSKEEN